ncbi:hypothetical protein [Rossellomorea aquimaris]|uniref:Response regulatory domain-containing protein n=1 Tax=Rossellomorea aquimaris TaxID=189382 RepID=A0A5D4UMG7_9BACI|nr:hypothetical protein [Rossellomorea aquimaris]TYS81724.1 hypothetical protein FZD05_02600 [Rossellomorea aquimaris]TYS88348.1 hypothetical protein FZC85_02600 [Rossellomorea aquimaris]
MTKELTNTRTHDQQQKVTEINVLIIEDDDDQFEVIQDSINEFNEENPFFQLKYRWASNYNAALIELISEDYDSAIIDLQLDSTKSSDDVLDGNKLIDLIIHKLRFPIFVRTGFPGKVQAEEHNFFKVYSKTYKVDDIISEIVTIYKKGITNTIGTKGKVEKYLNEIFWERLSHNINEWDAEFLLNKEHEISLVRYCMSLLNEYLEINTDGDQLLEYHPFEVFIKPPIKPYIFFGDIIFESEKNQFYIVLSPPCDMAQKKYEKIIIAEIELLESIDEINEFKTNYYSAECDKKLGKARKAQEKIIGVTSNNYKDKYHYLPSYQEFPGGLINFQKIQSYTLKELEGFNIFASINSKFGKDITARFSQYLSRQGQPNLNNTVILKNILGVKELLS